MLIIDTHAHIYSPDEKRYPPRENPLRPPKGQGSAEHLHEVMLKHGVSAVRAIQTVTFYGYDNRYLCDAAKAHTSWMAGVCNVHPDNPESPAILRRLIREYGVKALRSVPSDAHKDAAFDDPGVRALWKVIADEGAAVDIFLMRREWVPSASKLIADFPKLTIGFDHCMDLKPGPQLESDVRTVCRLSRFKSLYPKVDFIATGTQQRFPCEDLHHACMEIIGAYGAERCVWASSYPNELWTPKVNYGEYIRIFAEVLPLKDRERRLILGENAQRLWFPKLKAV